MRFEIKFISVKDRLPTKEDLQQSSKILCIVEVPIEGGKYYISYRVVECSWDYYMKEPAFGISDCIIRAWASLPFIKEIESCNIIKC